MALITPDTKLSEIILHDPSTITVLDRFGISLGVGDLDVAQACLQHNINVNFFTAILNTFIHEDYFPQDVLAQFSASEIVDYLSKTNSYYHLETTHCSYSPKCAAVALEMGRSMRLRMRLFCLMSFLSENTAKTTANPKLWS